MTENGNKRQGGGFLGKARKLFFSPAGTVGLFALAAVLLLSSSIGGARAALTYFSETYVSRVQMYDIGVSLLENGERISWRDYGSRADGTWSEHTGVLLAHMLDESDGQLTVGRTYREEISVRNSGTINQYVRVNVYKYWLVKDEDGEYVKARDTQTYSPDLIDLHLLCDATGYDNGWLLDEEASTPERTVLYYDRLLYAGADKAAAEGTASEGEAVVKTGPSVTPILSDTLTIDGVVAERVTEEVRKEGNYTTIVTTYQYDDVKFQLEVRVDAVQEHNAEEAVWSAWGRRVNVENDTLTLAD